MAWNIISHCGFHTFVVQALFWATWLKLIWDKVDVRHLSSKTIYNRHGPNTWPASNSSKWRHAPVNLYDFSLIFCQRNSKSSVPFYLFRNLSNCKEYIKIQWQSEIFVSGLLLQQEIMNWNAQEILVFGSCILLGIGMSVAQIQLKRNQKATNTIADHAKIQSWMRMASVGHLNDLFGSDALFYQPDLKIGK